MIQERTDQNRKRHRQHNSKASCKSLHNSDSDIIGVDNLLVRKVVGVVQEEHAYTASGKGKIIIRKQPCFSSFDAHLTVVIHVTPILFSVLYTIYIMLIIIFEMKSVVLFFLCKKPGTCQGCKRGNCHKPEASNYSIQ